MNRYRLDRSFQYVYTALVGVFCVSVVLAALSYGVVRIGGLTLAPLAGEAAGRAAILGALPSASSALAGETVVSLGDAAGVVAHTVESVSRENGVLYVHTSEGAAIAARDVHRSVLFTVPLLGYWLKALAHPIGLVALIAMPLLMIAIDVVQILLGSSMLARLRSIRIPERLGKHDDELQVTLPHRHHGLTMHV